MGLPVVTEPQPIGAVEACDLVEARRALRALVDASGLAMLTIDELAGLPRGYTAKVLGEPPMRGLSSQSIFNIAGAVGHKIVFVPDERAARRIKAHHAYIICDDRQKRSAEHFRNTKALLLVQKWGSEGAKKMLANHTPEQLSLIRSKAAKKRWRRFRKAMREMRKRPDLMKEVQLSAGTRSSDQARRIRGTRASGVAPLALEQR